MTKKRIRYSELAPETPAAAASAEVDAVRTPQASVPVPAAVAPEPAPASATPKRAPVDLARALAAARAAEQQAAAITLPPPAQSVDAMKPASPQPAVVVRPAAAPAPRTLRDQVRVRTGVVDILVFRIGSERFAVDLATVEEAIDIPPVHHVPEMPAAMLGVITVRGALTSVYSPASVLGVSLHDGTSALIFRRGRARLAIVVDEVDDAASLDLSLLRDAPVLDASDGVVLGVVRQHDALLALVDTDALLAACQATSLLETA